MASFRILSLPALAIPAFALSALLVGCNDNQKTAQNDILKSNDDLTKQVSEKDDKLGSLGEQLARAQAESADLRTQLEACKSATPETAIAERATAEHTTRFDTKAFSGITGVDVAVEGNELHLVLANSILFDSGRVSIKDGARHTLDKVATKLKELYPTRELVVVGHTDSDPIRKSSYATNYHLGFERAYAVREYLLKKGIAESHVALMSYGPDQPAASKEKSRRIEIVVTATDAKGGSVESPKNAAASASKATASKKAAPASGAKPAHAAQVKKTASSK